MAKKVRRKVDEHPETAFEFPEFDEAAFVSKEFEMMGALLAASGITVAMGVASWLASLYGLPWYAPFSVGLLVLVVSPLLLRRLRRRSSLYTKGDWAGLLALEFFGWLAIWFLLVDVRW